MQVTASSFSRAAVAILIGLLILLAPKPARALLDGEWTGWGEWLVVGMETYPAEWAVENKNLLFETKVVGSYDGNNFELREQYNENTYIITKITVDGLHLDYEEIWYEKDDAILYEIRGRLFKKQKQDSGGPADPGVIGH